MSYCPLAARAGIVQAGLPRRKRDNLSSEHRCSHSKGYCDRLKPLRASLSVAFVLLTAGTAATTKSAARRVRYRGGETRPAADATRVRTGAAKPPKRRRARRFFTTLGDAIATVWEKTPEALAARRRLRPRALLLRGRRQGRRGGAAGQRGRGRGEVKGRWVAERAGAASADDLRRALAKGTVFFNGAGLAFPISAALGALQQARLDCRRTSTCTSRTRARGGTDAPPNSDAQNVLVFQCTGKKGLGLGLFQRGRHERGTKIPSHAARAATASCRRGASPCR